MPSTRTSKRTRKPTSPARKIGCDVQKSSPALSANAPTGVFSLPKTLLIPEQLFAEEKRREQLSRWVTQAISMYEKLLETFTPEQAALYQVQFSPLSLSKDSRMYVLRLTLDSWPLENPERLRGYLSYPIVLSAEKSAS